MQLLTTHTACVKDSSPTYVRMWHYLNEGCEGCAHCLSAMFHSPKQLVHQVEVSHATELNQVVKSYRIGEVNGGTMEGGRGGESERSTGGEHTLGEKAKATRCTLRTIQSRIKHG